VWFFETLVEQYESDIPNFLNFHRLLALALEILQANLNEKENSLPLD